LERGHFIEYFKIDLSDIMKIRNIFDTFFYYKKEKNVAQRKNLSYSEERML